MVTGSPAAARPAPLAPARATLMLIVNPRASRSHPGELDAAVRALRRSFEVDVRPTEGRGHASELARRAADEGFTVVAAAGGDGTFGETAHGLAGTDTAMACLPTGCTNVFPRALGSPRRALEAAERLAALEATGRMSLHAIDLGTVNGRHFVCTSGVGFSASMTAAGDQVPHRKARLGQLHFVAAGVAELGRRYMRDPPRMRVLAGGRSAEGVTAVVQNSRALTYFGRREIVACQAAGLQTGAVSLTLLRRSRVRDVAPVVLRLLSRSVADHPEIETFPALAAATVVSADGRPLPLEADGEYLGEHQRIEFGVAAGALRVVSQAPAL